MTSGWTGAWCDRLQPSHAASSSQHCFEDERVTPKYMHADQRGVAERHSLHGRGDQGADRGDMPAAGRGVAVFGRVHGDHASDSAEGDEIVSWTIDSAGRILDLYA